MELKAKEKTTKIVYWSIGIGAFVLLITIFAVFDQRISQSIYEHDIHKSTLMFTTIVGEIGLVLPGLPFFFTLSVIIQRLLNCNRLMFKKTLYWTLIVLTTGLVLLHTNLGFILGTNNDIDKEIMIMASVLYVIAIAIYQGWFWTKKSKDYLYIERQFYLGLRAIAYLIIINLMVTTMKFTFGRPRPYQVLEEGYKFYYPFEINFSDERGVSFPSGHTISAMNLFALSILFLSNVKTMKKVSVNTTFSIIVFLVALSRVLWIKHWSTDVLTAMGIGTLFFNLMKMTYVKRVNQLQYMFSV